MMTPDGCARARELLAAAIEWPPEQRTAARIREACGGDGGLAAEVETLLAAHEAAIGQRLGAYRIEAEIARGGMGTVYRATRADDEFRKQVAIKVVDRAVASPRSLDLFRHERQILAGLEHPNIARLIDGGTTRDGSPYLVMEYVEGERIDRYCEDTCLSIDGRLGLFVQACAAVHHAHQHLVVHRDIKPANLLVTPTGDLKLLDFGIAQMVGPPGAGTTPTASGPSAMTPAYASPEQLRGEPITTAADVYSLGLVLYGLLSGRHPYQFGTRLPHDIARVILESEPEPPSAAVRRAPAATSPAGAAGWLPSRLLPAEAERRRRCLAGDLDTIVMKAIRKDPSERYASVEQLAQDIQRHLEGRPIAARSQTLRYRATKFVRRHAAAVTVAALVVAALSATVVMTIRFTAIARAERALADRRFAQLRELAGSNLFELHDAIQQLPGSAAARNLLIQRSLQYLDGLNAETGDNRDLEADVAAGYERIAQLQGSFSSPGIADWRAALASHGKALAIRETLVAQRPGDRGSLTALARSLKDYSFMLQKTGRTMDAARVSREALAASKRVVRLAPGDAQALRAEADAYVRLALVEGGNGSSGSTREMAAAIEDDRRALAILGVLPGGGDDEATARTRYAVQLRLGFHLQKARMFREAAGVFDGMVAGAVGPAASPLNALYVYNYRGLAFERAGDQRKALDNYEASLRLARSLGAADPSDLNVKTNLAIAEGHVGVQTARLGRTRSGLRQLDEAIDTAESLLAANPSVLFYRNLLAAGYSYQAEILSMLGDHAAAEARCRAALNMAAEVSRADPQDLESPLNIAKIHASLGVVLGRAGRYAEARTELSVARDGVAALLRLRPDDAEGAYLEQLVQDDADALERCSDGERCRTSGLLRLPAPVN